VLFNPAPLTKGILDAFPFDSVSILVVNEHEAKGLYTEMGGENQTSSEKDLATELLTKFEKMQGIIITLGGEGVIAKFRYEDNVQDFKVASRKVDVKDTTGAGDTFVVSAIKMVSMFFFLVYKVSYLGLFFGCLH
jgi:ribokinase